MMGNCQRKSQIMWNTICKQKDEGKREKLTNPMAYFDHSLLNMLPLHPLWFYSSAYCRWMVLAEHGSSRRSTNPSPYWRDLCAWLPALCAVYFSRHEHDARGVFMSMQRHFRGAAHDGSHHFRVCVQQLTAGTVTEQSQEWAVGLESTSAKKSLFHAAATGYVWFTLWWTSERDLWMWHRPQLHNWHSTRRPQLCTELWTSAVSAPNGRPTTFVRRYKKMTCI